MTQKEKNDLFLANPPYHIVQVARLKRFWTGHYDAKQSTKVHVDTDAQVLVQI